MTLASPGLDGVEFVVDEAVAFQSELIRDMNAGEWSSVWVLCIVNEV